MAVHLAPAWLASFDGGTEAQKTALLTKLLSDWLHAVPPGVDHCSAVVELLSLAKASAARRSLIESTIVQQLTDNLAVPSLQAAAANATARWLDRYPSGVTILGERLSMVLAAPGHPPCLFDGLERVATLSQLARTSLFPAILEARIADLLDGSKGFDEARRGFGDVHRLAPLLEVSPYAASLDVAFAP